MLRRLFDFQRFANNTRLGRLIADTENRSRKPLEDGELDLLYAGTGIKIDLPNDEKG